MTAIVPHSVEEQLRSGEEHSPELEQLMRNARDASDFLKALSHESAEKERSVSELENILSLRQPTVSQQLARLRFDDLVTTRRDGKTVYYSLANENVRQVIAVIYDMFCKGGTKTAS
jgi:DNA-binding transcriptional ArsR family regulator